MIPKLISKIYVINLKRCIDRKKHIIEEFKRVNFNNYEIFEATDKDDIQVKNMMDTNFVKKFPPCFRCNKNRCKCSNNILIKHQIGNWCSFINVMNDIIKNDTDNLIMICEDDIKFTRNGLNVLNYVITKYHLERYRINLKKPVLIRAGSQIGNRHILKNTPKLEKKIIMSNPCFICNKYFAKSFIKNLKIINTTSDLFIHRDILLLDKSIQSFTISPQPIYELSCGKLKKFKSEIHPKKLNKNDRIMEKNHIKKIIYKEFLCIGHPRCGTGSVSFILKQMGYDVGHENMGINGVSSWMLAVEDIYYPWGNIKNKKRYYFKNIIQIIRNPFDAIPSIILENKYSPNNKSYNFRKKHIKRLLNIDLPDININNEKSLINDIELAVKTFIYWNRICELCQPKTICKIEEISPLQKFNFRKKKIDKTKRNSNKKFGGKKYNKPIINKDLYEKINDELKEELKKFCRKYNYECLL